MNIASVTRLEAARLLASRYADIAHVAGVMVTGSVARGSADRYSDLDLKVLWNEPPTSPDRESVLVGLPGDLVRLYDFDPDWRVWTDAFTLGHNAGGARFSGLTCDIGHMLVEDAESFLIALRLDHTTEEPPHNFAALVASGQPLCGELLIQAWQRDLDYPDPLAVAMIEKHGQIEFFWRWRSALDRGGNHMLAQHNFVRCAQQLLQSLVALNRTYFCGFGHLEWIFEQLRLAPPAFSERFQALWKQEPSDLAAALSALIEEMYDVIEAELPGVNVERLRRLFRYERTTWEEAPPDLL